MGVYDHLDARIMKRLDPYAPKPFYCLLSGDIFSRCSNHSKAEPARVLGRRLQALRKKGLIRFDKGWVKSEG